MQRSALGPPHIWAAYTRCILPATPIHSPTLKPLCTLYRLRLRLMLRTSCSSSRPEEPPNTAFTAILMLHLLAFVTHYKMTKITSCRPTTAFTKGTFAL